MCRFHLLIPLLFFINLPAMGGLPAIFSVETDTCNTPTFYQRIKDAQGRNIYLQELQTLPGGNFIAAGNITVNGNSNEGLLLKYGNGGLLLQQQQVKVDNKPVSIFDMKITLFGKIIVTGTINDGSNTLFLLQLNEAFTPEWTKTISNNSPTTKVTLQLFDDKIALASQQNSAIRCSMLDNNGAFIWTRIVSIPDLVSLAGFGQFNWSPVGLVANCLRNGKNLVEIYEIDAATGNPVSTHVLGDGVTENICLETIAFTAQAHLLGVVKKAPNDFRLVRYNTFTSSSIETEHNYKIAGTVNFGISAAMDNAADAMGFCLPQDGRLIFIKQFSAYQTSPEHTRQYIVPLGSTIKAVTRSADGGFLFGLNSTPGEIILIKTDSTGTLPGCGFTDIPNDFHEIFNVANTAVNRLINPLILPSATAAITFSNASITGQFNCNQYFCPPAPVIDTCLSTYYKTLRSGSYAEVINGYSIMRNDRRFVVSTNMDRILGGTTQLKTSLNLLDEKGNFIKGVTVLKNDISPSLYTYKMTDSTIMLIQYFTVNGSGCYNFTLLTDDFQIVWTKTIKTNQELINGEGFIYGGYHRDIEGNFYVVGSNPGYFARPKINVLKMDAAGNQLWAKSYEFTGGTFSTVKISSTYSCLMVVAEGYNPGGVSVRIDKNTGQMLNSYVYNNVYNGGNSPRYLSFVNDRLMYFGNDYNNNLLMCLFDTTGKPFRLKKIITATPTVFRAGAFKGEKFYGMHEYYSGTVNKDVLMKVDSSLHIDWITENVMDPRGIPSGIDVGNNGNIYVAGNYYYGWNSIYADAYLRKYSSTGTIGTCNFNQVIPVVQDVNPNPVTLGFTTSDISFLPETYVFNLVPDTTGQNVARVLCSSVSVCDSIRITGPDTVCQLNTAYTFKINKNSGCLLNNEMLNDSAGYQISLITDSSAVISFKKPGDVWLRTFINTGCKIIRDSMQVHVSPVVTSLQLGNDTSLCPGDSLILSAGNGFSAYLWQDGSTGNRFTVKDSGLYIVTVRNQCGEPFSDSIRVALYSVPPLNLPPATTICALDTVRVSNPPGFINYNWQPAGMINITAGAGFIIAGQNTWIKLGATTNNGCTQTDSFFINVHPLPLINLGNDSAFCDYDSVQLSAGNSYHSYLWSTGNTTATIIAKSPALYWLKVTDNNGCHADDSILLSYHPHTQVNLGGDFNLCAGSSKILDAQHFSQYLWQNNSTAQYFTAVNTGIYYVTVQDANGCKSADSVSVLNIFPVPDGFLNNSDSICKNQPLTLAANRSFTTYLWSDNSSLSYLKITSAGRYSLTVTDSNGCSATESIEVFEKDCFQGLYFPNAFTPNGDSRNDLFKPKLFGTTAMYMLEVYNRYGELVFYTSDPNKGWDGMYKGIPSPNGNYVWQCRYRFNNQLERFLKGNLVLIRQ